MTDKTPIRALIEAVEVLDTISGEAAFFASLEAAFGRQGNVKQDVCRAFYGSLDAALTLHDALLPGWGWRKNHYAGSKPDYETWWVTYPNNWLVGHTANYTDGNPSRAWLLAILKAYEAQV